jgi:hypothetical protein
LKSCFLLLHYKLVITTGTVFLRHKKDIEQELFLETNSDEAVSPDSDKDIDTDRGRDEDSAAASGSQVRVWSRTQVHYTVEKTLLQEM